MFYITQWKRTAANNSNLWGKTEVAFEGEFSFYTSKGNSEDQTFEWIEYSARFIGGRLEEVNRK